MSLNGFDLFDHHHHNGIFFQFFRPTQKDSLAKKIVGIFVQNILGEAKFVSCSPQ